MHLSLPFIASRRREKPVICQIFFRLCERNTHLLRSHARQASATLRIGLKP